MYRAGHLGLAMLVYAPVGAVLVWSGEYGFAVLGELCMIGLASLPDADHDIPFVEHRGATHTVGFALLVGLVLGAIGWLLSGQPAAVTTSEFAVFGFVIGVLSVGAHLLGDVLTPMGIRPFRPLWNRRFTLGLTRADNTVANYAFLTLGVFVTVTTLFLTLNPAPWM